MSKLWSLGSGLSQPRMGRAARTAALVIFRGGVILAQTFSNIAVTDVGPHSARMTGAISQDGWAQVNDGTTNSGPLTCSASPCLVPDVPNGAVLVQIAYLNSRGATILKR